MGRELPTSAVGAERRHLTVMFCDLVGSSALSTQFDPEDFREIIGAYQKTCSSVIERYGGYVARYVGDGILAYFGYPEAHEDDTERAVRAAFGIIETLPEISESLTCSPRLELAVRVGVASGLVVAGDITGPESTEQHAVVGQTPNLAARLQGLAEPNSVLISSHTRQLLGEQFKCESLGTFQLNGFNDPIVAWRVVQPSAGLTRYEATHARGGIPMVDRKPETELLLQCWSQAKEGNGQSVLIAGEAGIGKSRLAESLGEQLAAEPHIQLRYQCHSFSQSSAFYPIIQELERAAQHSHEDTPEEKLAKLHRLLSESSCDPNEVLPLFANLLSIRMESNAVSVQLSPRQQKERTLAALADHFIGLAEKRPVFALVEDLHWMDPSSRELFDLIWERVGAARILLVVTTREQHIPLAWSKVAHASTIGLERLDHDDSVAMTLQVARDQALPTDMLEEIVQRTDGVPLHVEELTKSILTEVGPDATATKSIDISNLPVSLRGSLMARLDQLGTAKRIAQYAAVIGREFSLRQLADVSGLSLQMLKSGLESLVRSELVYQYGLVSEPAYVFKHALVHEAAHDSLLHKERRDLHRRTADALLRETPSLAETQPELLAHHYSLAGDIENAIRFWLCAGKRSIERCAFVEANSHLRRALDLLSRMPSSPERDEQEFDAQMAIGGAVTAMAGYAAPEAGEAFNKALQLCRKLDQPQKLFATLYGVGGFHIMRTELDDTEQIGEEILTHARTYGDETAKLLGFRLLAAAFFLRGDLLRARDHLHQVIALYDINKHPLMIPLNSEDYLTTGLAYLSLVETLLGNLDQGLEASERSLTHAKALGHQYSYAYALSFCQFVHSVRGEWAAVRERSVELISLSREQEYALFLASARHQEGAALVNEGQVAEGLALIQSGTTEYVSLGVSTFVPFGLGAVALALARSGRLDAALETIVQAQAMADKSGEQWNKPDLVRQHGELLIVTEDETNVVKGEQLLREAIALAIAQQAALWELRASISLAKFLVKRNQVDEARQTLITARNKLGKEPSQPDVEEASQLLAAI